MKNSGVGIPAIPNLGQPPARDNRATNAPRQFCYPAKAMHDLSYFRDHLDVYAEMAKKRNITLDLDSFKVFDKERRELITQTEQLKAKRNKASDEIATLKKEKKPADGILAEMAGVSKQIKESDERITNLDNI